MAIYYDAAFICFDSICHEIICSKRVIFSGIVFPLSWSDVTVFPRHPWRKETLIFYGLQLAISPRFYLNYCKTVNITPYKVGTGTPVSLLGRLVLSYLLNNLQFRLWIRHKGRTIWLLRVWGFWKILKKNFLQPHEQRKVQVIESYKYFSYLILFLAWQSFRRQ